MTSSTEPPPYPRSVSTPVPRFTANLGSLAAMFSPARARTAPTQGGVVPSCPSCGELEGVRPYHRPGTWVCTAGLAENPTIPCSFIFSPTVPARICPKCAKAQPLAVHFGMLAHECTSCSTFSPLAQPAVFYKAKKYERKQPKAEKKKR